MINCMYVCIYMYVFRYLLLSSLVGKSYLSEQALLHNLFTFLTIRVNKRKRTINTSRKRARVACSSIIVLDDPFDQIVDRI